jgi:hypothetical protein
MTFIGRILAEVDGYFRIRCYCPVFLHRMMLATFGLDEAG